ncbi:MAG: LysE family transporter [Steroidobacteraceae bacterium]
MAGAIWMALVFGVVVAASIGPIALLILGTGARRGFGAACFAGLGAALADLVYALAAFSIGALVLPLLERHEAAIRVGCALLLVGLGLAMLISGARSAGPPPAPRDAARTMLPTFLLTLVNPMTLALFAGFVPQLPVAGSLVSAIVLALALFAGSFLVQAGFAAAGAALGAALPGRGWQHALNYAAAAGILAFGLAGLVAAIRGI